MLVGHQPKEFLLAVEALTVSFDGFKAVNDLSFYVDENEIRVIIGPNGAGKTTVLDLICGKTKATSGSIQFRVSSLPRNWIEPDVALVLPQIKSSTVVLLAPLGPMMTRISFSST